MNIQLASTLTFDLSRKGCRPYGVCNLTVNSDAPAQLESTNLRCVQVLGTGHTSGSRMWDKRPKDGNANQACAEALMANDGSIPKEWCRYILVFAGTLWETHQEMWTKKPRFGHATTVRGKKQVYPTLQYFPSRYLNNKLRPAGWVLTFRDLSEKVDSKYHFVLLR